MWRKGRSESLDARVPEAAFAASAARQRFRELERRPGDGGDDQLGDAIAAPELHPLGAPVDEQDRQLTPVVRVDGPGRVGQADAELEREPAAGPHLAFVPGWN